MLSGILFIASSYLFSSLDVLKIIPIIILAYFDIRYITTTNTEYINSIRAKIGTKSTELVESDRANGYFWGTNYVGKLCQTQYGDPEITLLCSTKTFKELIENDRIVKKIKVPNPNTNNRVNEANENNKIKIWSIHGAYKSAFWSERTITFDFEPTAQQAEIIGDIIKVFNEGPLRKCVALLHGEMGCGKSTIALLLARKIKSSLTKGLDPTQPSNKLSALLSRDVDRETPTIAVFEEVDIMLRKISNGIGNHKDYMIDVKNVSEWNTYMDDMGTIYSNVIVIMTSNKSPATIIEQCLDGDRSCLREGRVDYVRHVIMDKK